MTVGKAPTASLLPKTKGGLQKNVHGERGKGNIQTRGYNLQSTNKIKDIGPSRSLGRRRRRIVMCSENLIGYWGFSRQRVFIGKGASSEVDQGGLTLRGRGQALGHATLVCGPLMAPLQLLFSSLEAPVKFWVTGFGFVQFWEYFLCNFSETQK
jgi:hypothetical protein